MMRRLDVWWDGRIVGMLTQDRFGELGFGYSLAWLDDVNALPLSASLPKRAEPFTRRECRPFFGGLLPEEGQRDAAAKSTNLASLRLGSFHQGRLSRRMLDGGDEYLL